MNNSGPRTEPCGTPVVTLCDLDSKLLNFNKLSVTCKIISKQGKWGASDPCPGVLCVRSYIKGRIQVEKNECCQ